MAIQVKRLDLLVMSMKIDEPRIIAMTL